VPSTVDGSCVSRLPARSLDEAGRPPRGALVRGGQSPHELTLPTADEISDARRAPVVNAVLLLVRVSPYKVWRVRLARDPGRARARLLRPIAFHREFRAHSGLTPSEYVASRGTELNHVPITV
jgi:hypothetical protein